VAAPGPHDWIVVPNWERFQHYKHRDPPWIKTHRALLRKDEWLGLPFAARGLLTGIWLMYAAQNQELAVHDLYRLGRDPHRSQHLEWLNDAGFVHFSASSLLAKTLCNSVTPVDARARESEPDRDPHALDRIRQLTEQIWSPHR
jgi:hypothetical protein